MVYYQNTSFNILNTSSSETDHGEYDTKSRLRAVSAAAVILSRGTLNSFKLGETLRDARARWIASTAPFAVSATDAALGAPRRLARRAIFSGRDATRRCEITGNNAADAIGFEMEVRAFIAADRAAPIPEELTAVPNDARKIACANESAPAEPLKPALPPLNNFVKSVNDLSKIESERKFVFAEQYASSAVKSPSTILTAAVLLEINLNKLLSRITAEYKPAGDGTGLINLLRESDAIK